MTNELLPNRQLIEQVLGSGLVQIEIKGVRQEEDSRPGLTRVRVEFCEHGSDITQEAEGQGADLIHALWSALVGHFAREHHSLNSLRLASVSMPVRGDTEAAERGADAMEEVTLKVYNGGNEFFFSAKSQSEKVGAAQVVARALEYFVNAERTFITLCKAVQDAQTRNRSDLVARYTRELSEIVKTGNYSNVFDAIKKDDRQ